MYALKIISNSEIHNYSLGCEYHIQREHPTTNLMATAIVHGEDSSRAWDIHHDVDAYITTSEGKTVEVIHRIAWPN